MNGSGRSPVLKSAAGASTPDSFPRSKAIQSYTRLKREIKSFPHTRETKRRFGPRGMIAEFIVLDAITAAVESGQLHRGNCYSTVFKDRRDWHRLAADLGHKYHSIHWMNERYVFALERVLENPVTDFTQLADDLVNNMRYSRPAMDEDLSISPEDEKRLEDYIASQRSEH